MKITALLSDLLSCLIHSRLNIVVEKLGQAHRGWLAAVRRDQTVALELLQSFFGALSDPLVARPAFASGFRPRLALLPQAAVSRRSLSD